jgi:hypothetical protein
LWLWLVVAEVAEVVASLVPAGPTKIHPEMLVQPMVVTGREKAAVTALEAVVAVEANLVEQVE